MKAAGFVILFVLSAIGLRAQDQWAFEFWHEGKVVLVEGDTLNGMVKYDMQQDLVQFSFKDSKPEVYTARKVMFFEIFDATIHRYRRFFSLPFATSPGYKSMIFFELLAEGKMTLLAREFLEYKNQNSMYVTYARLVLSHRFFFMKENGDIEEFKGTKHDLLDMMDKKGDLVEKYMRKNRLRPENRDDMIRIVDYYNALHES